MKKHEHFKRSLLSLALISMSSTYVSPVVAEQAEEEIEKIMVTGSRIARTELASASPITLEAVYLSRLIFVRDKSVLVAASSVSPSYSKQILLNKE